MGLHTVPFVLIIYSGGGGGGGSGRSSLRLPTGVDFGGGSDTTGAQITVLQPAAASILRTCYYFYEV